MPDADIDGIEPQHIVGQRCTTRAAELRSHDSRHDVHAWRICSQRYAVRMPRQLHEVLVFIGTEIANELPRMLAGNEQMLDLTVAPREPVIRGDMVQRKLGASHAMRLTGWRAALPPPQAKLGRHPRAAAPAARSVLLAPVV